MRFPKPRLAAAAVLTALALVLVVLGTWRPVAAHAELDSTEPAASSVVATSPQQIVLTFTEAVDPLPDSIRLLGGDGETVELPAATQPRGDNTLAVDVPALADGSYVVAWRAVSADSHPINGAFTFSVGAPSEADAGVVSELLDADQGSRAAEGWLAVGRAASYLGVAVLVGGYLVLAGCARHLLARRRSHVLLAAGAAVAGVGTALMISAQALLTVGSVWQWGDVVDSRAGRWWLARLVLVGAGVFALVALVVVRLTPRPRLLLHAAAIAGATVLVGVVAAGGHGVSGRWVVLGFAATTVHVLAMAVWLGGLSALAFVVPRGERWGFASRFSAVALGAVLSLSASGVVSAWRQASSWTALRESNYGSWLVAKLVVVAGVLAVAAASRWLVRMRPAATAAAGARSVGAAATGDVGRGGRHIDDDAVVGLRRAVVAEVIGIVVVLAVTAGLVSSPPPTAGAETASSARSSQGERTAEVTLEPPATGGADVTVTLTSAAGSEDVPRSVTLAASSADANIERLRIPLTAVGPGVVRSDDVNLPLPGRWTFEVTARYGEFEQLTFIVEIDVG